MGQPNNDDRQQMNTQVQTEDGNVGFIPTYRQQLRPRHRKISWETKSQEVT